jgi:hypothetical protein
MWQETAVLPKNEKDWEEFEFILSRVYFNWGLYDPYLCGEYFRYI